MYKKIIKLLLVGIITFVTGINLTYAQEVTFNLNKNGGTGGSSTLIVSTSQTGFAAFKKDGTMTTKVSIPTKKGYGFEGYYVGDQKLISRRGNVKQIYMSNYLKNITKNKKVELKAKWKAFKYTITLDPGDEMNDGVIESEKLYLADNDEGVAYDESSKQTDYIKVPESDNYIFNGYSITYNGETYTAISRSGKIEAIPYPSSYEKATEWNMAGYGLKVIALGISGKGRTLKASWIPKEMQKITSIYPTHEKQTIKIGQTVQIESQFAPGRTDVDTDLNYTSSDSRIATVSKDGKVTGLRAGEATIKIESSSNKDVNASVKIIVTTDGNDVVGNIMTVEIGETKEIIYTGLGSPDNLVEDTETESQTETLASYQATTDNISINGGQVTGEKVGYTQINALDQNRKVLGNIYVNVIELTEITAKQLAKENVSSVNTDSNTNISDTSGVAITCYLSKNTVKPNKSKQFNYTIYKQGNNKVTIKLKGSKKVSTNVVKNKYLKYNKDTNIMTGLKKGETEITIKVGNKKSRKCTVYVTDKLTKAQKSEISIDTKANDVVKTSHKVEEGTTNSNGSGGSPGKTVKKIKISGPKTVKVKKKIQLKATITPKGSTAKVKWSVSPKSKAKITQKGKLTGKKAGKVTVKVKAGKKQATKKITIKKAKKKTSSNTTPSTPSTGSGDSDNTTPKDNGSKAKKKKMKISCKSSSITVGSTTSCSVKNAKGSVTWKSSDKSVATVSKKGKVKAKKVGKTTIIAKDSKKNKKTITIKVMKGNVTHNNTGVTGKSKTSLVKGSCSEDKSYYLFPEAIDGRYRCIRKDSKGNWKYTSSEFMQCPKGYTEKKGTIYCESNSKTHTSSSGATHGGGGTNDSNSKKHQSSSGATHGGGGGKTESSSGGSGGKF